MVSRLRTAVFVVAWLAIGGATGLAQAPSTNGSGSVVYNQGRVTDVPGGPSTRTRGWSLAVR